MNAAIGTRVVAVGMGALLIVACGDKHATAAEGRHRPDAAVAAVAATGEKRAADREHCTGLTLA